VLPAHALIIIVIIEACVVLELGDAWAGGRSGRRAAAATQPDAAARTATRSARAPAGILLALCVGLLLLAFAGELLEQDRAAFGGVRARSLLCGIKDLADAPDEGSISMQSACNQHAITVAESKIWPTRRRLRP
jgi:putative intracellular protease/amidase